MSQIQEIPCQCTVKPSYPQTLKQAIDRHLPGSLFEAASLRPAVRWCERYLTLCVLMMAWSTSDTLADRFDDARRGLAAMFPGRRRPGKTYQGFISALTAKSELLLTRVSDHLRGEVRAMAQQAGSRQRWSGRNGFVPIGADGSKFECPKTAANEQAFGCAGKKKSTPQQFVTTLLHLPTGVVWEFKTGPAKASEREHLRQMLPTLPDNALLIADAGFTGYGLLSAILDDGHAFLIRVGANVRLLRKLGYAVEERAGTVYLWPEEVRCPRQRGCGRGRGRRAKRQRSQSALPQLPPLVLRLITFTDGRNRQMHLLSSVLDESLLSDGDAYDFYLMRWGVELHYRALKQTLARRKLMADAPATARMELRWSMAGLWLLSLMAASPIVAQAKDPRRLSVAAALRLVRRAVKAPLTRSGSAGLGRRLGGAVKDTYVRRGSKRARNWAHKKKPKPIGDPKARMATKLEVMQAQELRRREKAA